jgi:hypothetical protein
MVHCIKPRVELPEAVTKVLREKKETPNAVYCSFCRRSSNEVNDMLAGGMVNVCDECVELHYHILTERRKLNGVVLKKRTKRKVAT